MNIRGYDIYFVVDIIGVDEELKNVGRYETAEEACEAIEEAKRIKEPDEEIYLSAGEYYEEVDEYIVDIEALDELTYSDNDQAKVMALIELAEECVPSQIPCAIEYAPRRIVRPSGDKPKVDGVVKYICDDCQCEKGYCRCKMPFDYLKIVAPKGKVFDEPHLVSTFGMLPLQRDADKEDPGVLVCPYCFDKIEDCKCNEWPEYATNIDRNIQPIIKAFNDKGYVTRFCCEGHEMKDSAHIIFAVKYDFKFGLPDGWRIGKTKDIYSYYTEQCGLDFEEQKKRKMEVLEKWVEKLDTLDVFIVKQ